MPYAYRWRHVNPRGAFKWERLADALEEDIRSGRRGPGADLPVRGLMAEHGTTQRTVSLALGELVRRGLAVTEYGRTAYVPDVLPALGEPRRSLEERVAASEVEIAELRARVGRLEGERGD